MNGAVPFFGSFDYAPGDLLLTFLFACWVLLLIFFMYKARQWRKDAK